MWFHFGVREWFRALGVLDVRAEIALTNQDILNIVKGTAFFFKKCEPILTREDAQVPLVLKWQEFRDLSECCNNLDNKLKQTNHIYISRNPKDTPNNPTRLHSRSSNPSIYIKPPELPSSIWLIISASTSITIHTIDHTPVPLSSYYYPIQYFQARDPTIKAPIIHQSPYNN